MFPCLSPEGDNFSTPDLRTSQDGEGHGHWGMSEVDYCKVDQKYSEARSDMCSFDFNPHHAFSVVLKVHDAVS